MEEIFIVAVCLVLNAFFAAYEMAFVSVSRSELRKLVREGNPKAKALLGLRESPERTLSIIQIGITLVAAIAAAVGGAGAAEFIEPYLMSRFGIREVAAESIAVAVIVVPLTYLSVVLGELVPKTLALRNPTRIVLAGAGVLFLADRILSPVVSVLEWSTKQFLRVFFPRSRKAEQATGASVEIGGLSPLHQQFVLNMADIEKKRVADIFVPWDQVTHLSKKATVEEVSSTVLLSGHTRLPVAENGGVMGILHTKEFIALRDSGEEDWLSIIRPCLFVQPKDSVLGVLRQMQERRNHMAIVSAPQGDVLGIVTIEDVLEEVVGDIFDEDDDGRVRKIFASRVKTRPMQGKEP